MGKGVGWVVVGSVVGKGVGWGVDGSVAGKGFRWGVVGSVVGKGFKWGVVGSVVGKVDCRGSVCADKFVTIIIPIRVAVLLLGRSVVSRLLGGSLWSSGW